MLKKLLLRLLSLRLCISGVGEKKMMMVKVVDALVKKSAADTNVFVSPLSIEYALAMLQEGVTEKSEHAEALRHLVPSVPTKSDHEGILVANSLWIRGDSSGEIPTVEASYGLSLKKKFDALVDALTDSAKPINDFISTKTQGLIGPLVEDSLVRDPLTRALIVNAVYFKGEWAQAFDKAKTEPGTFMAANKVEQTVSFMHLEAKFSTRKLEDATAVALDYTSDLRAIFILPDEGVAPESLHLADWKAQVRPTARPTKVTVELPRFSLDFGTDLLPAIFEAHPPAACLRNKDNGFLRISKRADIHLSNLIHQATCSVDEQGTVAAAATVAVMKSRSLPRPSPILRFDRPFWFAIESKKEHGPLFFIGLVRTIVPPPSSSASGTDSHNLAPPPPYDDNEDEPPPPYTPAASA